MTDLKRVDDSRAINPRADARPARFTVRASSRRVIAICVVLLACSIRAQAQDLGAAPIPNAGWKLLAVDSQEAGYPASYAFDGDPATIWSTEWVAGSPPPPHDLQIDMGAIYSISGLRALPRQDGSPLGRITQFQVLSSIDGVTWTVAVDAGTWTNSGAEQQVLFADRTARYIWLRALAEVDGQPWTTLAELTVLGVVTPSPTGVISQAGWRLQSVDSQEANYPATNAFDGDPATVWTTGWVAGSPPPPHDLRIDLGAVYAIAGVRALPRQDGSMNGNIARYQIYVSVDGVTWGGAVASGTWSGTAAEQQVLFSAKTGRYLRLRALTAVDGQPWTVLAELNVIAAATGQPPNGVIVSPAADVTIAPGQTVMFNGSGTDPDGQLPLSYAWTFGAGSPASSASQNPGAVTFSAAGVYSAALTVSDSTGMPDPTPAVRTITVQPPLSGTPISQAGWKLRFVDSEETVAGPNSAANAFDGDPSTVWATQWKARLAPLPHEIQIDLGSVYDLTGFRYLPRQDGASSGRIAQYAFYVSQDGITWGAAVATATFPNSAAEQQVTFNARQGQYIRLRALSVFDGAPWIVVAELNVLGTGVAGTPPSVRTLQFNASVDDGTVLGYVLKVYRAEEDTTAANPTGAFVLDRPTKVNGLYTIDISALIATLPAGTYVATVTSVAAGGTGQSSASDPFVR